MRIRSAPRDVVYLPACRTNKDKPKTAGNQWAIRSGSLDRGKKEDLRDSKRGLAPKELGDS